MKILLTGVIFSLMSSCSFYQNYDVKCNSKILPDKSIVIEIVYHNNSDSINYIPISCWSIEGSPYSNFEWSFPAYNQIINQIIFFPSYYRTFIYNIESTYPLYKYKIPQFVAIEPNNNFSINIYIDSLSYYLPKDSTYKIEVSLPFVLYKDLESFLKLTKLKQDQIVVKLKHKNIFLNYKMHDVTISNITEAIGMTEIINDDNVNRYFSKDEYDTVLVKGLIDYRTNNWNCQCILEPD